MSDRKTIQVNMDLFQLPSNKTRKKKDPAAKKDIKMKASAHNATTKNKLLRYIREQQEKNYEKLFERDKPEKVNEKPIPVPSVLANSNSEFEQSIAYMKTVEEEKKKKNELRAHNATIKQRTPLEEIAFHNKQTPVLLNTYPNIVDSVAHAPSTAPIVSLKPRPTANVPAPTYGCLKNGNLPTYRSMMQQTIKNHSPNITIENPVPAQTTHSPVSMPPPPVQMQTQPQVPLPLKKDHHINIDIPVNTRLPEGLRQEQLKTWSELNQLREKMQQAKQGGAPKNLKYLKRKKTLRRTYNVGKSKVHPKVSVLVTNRTIRKKISTQAQQLKQMPIEEIRRYLMEKGLIKVGSIAPNDVLRQMYENAILIGGEVNNHNPENLLYNYLNAPQS